MKWFAVNLSRASVYMLIVLAFFIAVIVLQSCAPEPDKENPAIRDVYATANARIDAMQTSISLDLTAEAIKKATPSSR